MSDRPPPKSPPNAPKSPAGAPSGEAAERRAKALRENLLKRKSQARARAEPNAVKRDPER
jgi:hypothetical protein